MTIDQMIEKVGEWSNNVSQSTLIAHHPLNVKSKENGRGSKAELKFLTIAWEKRLITLFICAGR
ncbi:MAG: hypothetical protein IJO11_02060 [Alphaproteobacteria bacterium]|nr:hypothetical protein [Alphaproteobacteria bacterium]